MNRDRENMLIERANKAIAAGGILVGAMSAMLDEPSIQMDSGQRLLLKMLVDMCDKQFEECCVED